MAIRAIILDMDGTLLNSEKKITPRTKAALLKAQDEGMTLILASGRPINGLRKFANELDMMHHKGILVAYNGAMVWDCETGEILLDHRMSAEEGKAVLEHLKGYKVRPMIDKDEYMYVNNVFDNTIKYKGADFNVMQCECRGNGFLLCEKEDLAAFADFPISKILTFGEPEYLQQHYKELRRPFENKLNCMFTTDYYYEFTAKGVDKAKALQTVIEKKGFKREEMIAFGDAENDATMLRLAGIGVAMGNATDELKALADKITGTLDEDGIAMIVEDL